MRMWVYVVRRVALLVPVVIGVMTITFILVTALGPVQQLNSYFGPPPVHGNIHTYSPTIPCSDITPGANGTCANPLWDNLAPQLGLNQPIIVQWGYYIYHSFTFQWGLVANHSAEQQTFLGGLIRGQPVSTVLSWLLPYTLELAILSLAIILTVAIPLGNLSAVYRNRPIDQASRVMSFSGFAFPGFLLATLLVLAAVLLLGTSTLVHTPWCPSGETAYSELTGSWPSVLSPGSCSLPGASPANFGYPNWLTLGVISHPTGFPTVDAMIHGDWWLAFDSILRLVVPAMVIAFGTIAILLRFVRNSMLEVMNLDFVRTARAKGVPESTVVKRHAGRNSLNVTITVLGLTFAFFIGGFPIIEDVFQLNGVGLILTYSVLPGAEDFALIFGATLLFTFLVVAANIIVDVMYAYLDPRVRLG
ncbi:MAG: ABC transporter permease [Thermoplasmata archaeon]|nr:ABC transporter permease [Thermoplasmata archaeon]